MEGLRIFHVVLGRRQWQLPLRQSGGGSPRYGCRDGNHCSASAPRYRAVHGCLPGSSSVLLHLHRDYAACLRGPSVRTDLTTVLHYIRQPVTRERWPWLLSDLCRTVMHSSWCLQALLVQKRSSNKVAAILAFDFRIHWEHRHAFGYLVSNIVTSRTCGAKASTERLLHTCYLPASLLPTNSPSARASQGSHLPHSPIRRELIDRSLRGT